MAAAAPLADGRQEGRRIVAAAVQRGLPVRLIGGVAVWTRCPSAALPALERSYGDVDIVTLSRVRREVTDLLEELGYVGDRLFNALHGAQRLDFMDPIHQRPLDVIVDRFSMCHTMDLRDRLDVDPLTIPLAELLLSKLQVVELNAKDVKDIATLLLDHEVGGPAPETIDLDRIVAVLGADWGFEHTVRRNLDRLPAELASVDLAEAARATVLDRAANITAALDAGPKTARWKARRLVGERVRWYEEPEEVRH